MRTSQILILSCLAALTACGGGGGGSSSPTPANPDAVFQIWKLTTINEGESIEFDLTGTAKVFGQTEALTGSISGSRKPNEIVGGEEYIVADLVLVVRITSQGTSISSSNTSYFMLDGTLVRIEEDDGVICFPGTNYKDLPDSVKYGDSGNLGSAGCSDGTSLTGSYLVEVSDRNNAWAAIRQYSTYSEPGIPDIFEDIVYHVTEDGQLKAIDIVAGDGEVSFDLSS